MTLDRTLSVAPMIDRTDRHARYLFRLISARTLLYTEMITASALVHGDAERLLAYDRFEQPVALQVGGSEPGAMAEAARLAEAHGYAEVNINVGCPSDRVQSGAFGACLMAEPETVAACVRAMRAATSLPITVKTRIGIDHRDHYEDLLGFVDPVAEAGCTTFIIHARKAWLQGLSPKANREIPPLHHDRVVALKRDRPELEIIINGGIGSLAEVETHLERVDGCMLGRAPYADPWLLAPADERLWGAPACADSRADVVRRYLPYVRARMAAGVPLHHLTRHMGGLFSGCPGARAWRRTLAEGAAARGGIEVIEDALARVEAAAATLEATA